MANYTIKTAQEKDIQSIKKMQNENYIGIMVAVEDAKVIGYEMFLNFEYISQMPFWNPFMNTVKNLEYKGKKLCDYKLIIAGQACIDRGHKGEGIIENLHNNFVNKFKEKYDLIISEIAQKNPRSLHVFTKKVGFHIIDSYQADGKVWYVIVQDLRENQ